MSSPLSPPPGVDAKNDRGPQKLPVSAHLLCGWPLFLVFIGGAIGGAFGGLAYGVNIAVYKSRLPFAVKVLLNIVIGLSAIGLWCIAAAAIVSMRKS